MPSHIIDTPHKASNGSSPNLFQRIQEESLSSAGQFLQHMFSALDDLFYELSKRASTNNEANLYFESMRELRIKKKEVSELFIADLNTSFDEVTSSTPQSNDVAILEKHLAIVEGDDLEIDIAQKSMASRTEDLFKKELYEIATRLDHVLLQANINEKNNPIAPIKFSEAFVRACQDGLELNIKTRLIVFKLFEKHVLQQLGHIYADVNQLLIKMGILPKIPPKSSKKAAEKPRPTASPLEASEGVQQTSHTSSSHSAAPRIQNEPAVSLDGSAVATLMAAIRGGGSGSSNMGTLQQAIAATAANNAAQPSTKVIPIKPQALSRGAADTAATTNNYYVFTANPGPEMPSSTLAEELTPKQPEIDTTITRSGMPKNYLLQLVTDLLAERDPSMPQALSQSDEDTINLVALFFDKVLEDANLPIAVQTLICRLQIPILKVALNDKSFLSDKHHPARKLINTITQVGISLDEAKPIDKDPLFKKITDAVLIINKQFKSDVRIFTEIHQDLESLLKKESKRSTVVEKRTTQTEEGKVKVKHARAFAQTTLYEKMKGHKLHPEISQFLTSTWLQVLLFTYLKFGKESANWVENEQLITDLIWLNQEHTDDRSVARAQRLIPEILIRIEKGLESAIDSHVTRNEIIASIDDILNNKDKSKNPPQRQTLSNEQCEILGRNDTQGKKWEDMTALERQQSKYEQLSNKFYDQAKNIPLNSWVEYKNMDTGRTTRCKLSAKIDAECYIFVSRLGFKALEKTRRQFAYDMQFGKAKMLDSDPLFDRVMSNIINHFAPNVSQLDAS